MEVATSTVILTAAYRPADPVTPQPPWPLQEPVFSWHSPKIQMERWLYHHKEALRIAAFYRKTFVLVEQTIPDEFSCLVNKITPQGALHPPIS